MTVDGQNKTEARFDLEVEALAQARQPLVGHSQRRHQDRRQGRQHALDDALVHRQGGDPVDAHPDAYADLPAADDARPYRPPTTTTPPTVVTPTTTPPYSDVTVSVRPALAVPLRQHATPTTTATRTVSSPSPSGSSALGAPGEGDGTGSWAMTALAVLLVALVPIGALASYIRRQRLAASLGAAPQGKVLPGGGSAWQRLKGQFTRRRQRAGHR